MTEWPSQTVAELQAEGVLLVEDGNHGEYRPRPNEFVDDGTAFIRAADLSDGQARFATAGAINEVALQRIRKGVGKGGDILFSHKGTVGKLARAPLDCPPFVCSPQTTFWRVLDETVLRRDYLYAYMRSRIFIDQWWIRKGETDMADYVSLTAQRQLRVVVPPVEIQDRVAEPIVAIDDLIENNNRRVEVLEEMARAIYREWFVKFRYPGHEDVPLVDSTLGLIPEGWTASTIGDVLELKYGKALKADDRRAGDVAVVSSAGIVGWHDEAFVDGPAVVVGRKGNVGSVHWVDGPCWPIDTAYYVVTGLPLRFVDEQLRRTAFTNTHAAVPGLSRESAYAQPFLTPATELVDYFQSLVDPLGIEASALAKQSVSLASLRDLLLPKFVTGEIDVSSLDLYARVEESVA